jgi:tripartite-type tricarboxylate transporter receptor subunit TctC
MNDSPDIDWPRDPARRRTLLAGAGAVAGLLCPTAGRAQQFPTKPIRLIVPITPGGPSDLVGRIWAEKVGRVLGQSIVVDNKPGASHVLGTDVVAKSVPDGYTLLQAASNMAINPAVFDNLPFDTIKDFTPVGFTHSTPLVVVVAASVPVTTFGEFLDYLRKQADKVSYGTTGQGSPQQLATALIFRQAGISGPVEVPYKGSSQAHPDLLSGRVTFMVDPLAAVRPHVTSGALRALAVTTAARLDVLPAVPTVAESGLPGYEVVSWGGVFAPARTPAPVIATLYSELEKYIGSEEARIRFTELGLVPRTGGTEALASYLAAEITKWRGVLKPVRT